MRIKRFIFALSLIQLLLPSHGLYGAISISSISSESSKDSYLNDPDVSVITNSVFRAGGSETYEISTGDFATVGDTDDLAWNINGSHAVAFSYDSSLGQVFFSVTPSGGTISTVGPVEPLDWFNEIVIFFEGGPAELTMSNGDIEGESFGITAPASPSGSWDGILITFSNFSASNQESFTITGDLDISTGFPDLGGDQFRGEILLVQNVPEFSSFALFAGISTLFLILIRRK